MAKPQIYVFTDLYILLDQTIIKDMHTDLLQIYYK